jgi:hypothetical protein
MFHILKNNYKSFYNNKNYDVKNYNFINQITKLVTNVSTNMITSTKIVRNDIYVDNFGHFSSGGPSIKPNVYKEN